MSSSNEQSSNRGQSQGGSAHSNNPAPLAAITLPVNNPNPNPAPIPTVSQPAQPRNLQDLLRYSTEAGSLGGDRNAVHNPTPMDEESRKFLEDALKFMTVDVIEELLKSIQIVQRANELSEDSDPAECEAALDHIFEFVDSLDVANDFHKIGGTSILKPCLDSVHSSLRWRGAELIAELCQNNPYCQKKVLESGVLPTLLSMIDTDINDVVRIKALYAVSCLIRDNDEGLKEFTNKDGFSVLLRALQSDIEKLNIKSAFLLSALCTKKPHVKDEFIKMGYVEQLIGQIAVQIQKDRASDQTQSSEHYLSALLSLIQDHAEAQNICKRPDLQFREILNCIIESSKDKDEYREENEYAQSMLKTLFNDQECTMDQDR